MADASTNNNNATNDKGAGDGMALEECSESSLDCCRVLVILAEVVVIWGGVFRLYDWATLPLEAYDGELMLAKAVLGKDENTKLSDAKLITTSKTPSQSDVLVVWLNCVSF